MGDTPVPIPNTMVKTHAADGTWLETARESRTLPDPNRRTAVMRFFYFTPKILSRISPSIEK